MKLFLLLLLLLLLSISVFDRKMKSWKAQGSILTKVLSETF